MGLDRLYVRPPDSSCLDLMIWPSALPVVVLNSPAVSDLSMGGSNPKFGTGADIVGIILFIIGFYFEAEGDLQKVRLAQSVVLCQTDAAKYLFKASNPPKGKPCTRGLWYFSRHPPYFGEITLQWGLWALCREFKMESARAGAERGQ